MPASVISFNAGHKTEHSTVCDIFFLKRKSSALHILLSKLSNERWEVKDTTLPPPPIPLETKGYEMAALS